MTDSDVPPAHGAADDGRPAGLPRRGLLAGIGGAAVGASAVGAAWWALRPDRAAVTTTLPTAPRLGHSMLWNTLGTCGGPTGSAARAQPANLLYDGAHAAIVDAGDGVVDQLVKAGLPLTAIQTVVLSHLHIDHTAGLMGVVGRRLQQQIVTPLTVYGPPGTADELDRVQTALSGLVDLMAAGNPRLPAPAFAITVHEVTEGDTFTVGSATASCAINSHYGFAPGSADARRFQSLSYRFDMPDRSIAFTGDTGPIDAVVRLARDADLLVTEINDADLAVARVRASRPDLPALALPALRKHFAEQHLSATDVGKLARDAGVGSVVCTHNALDNGAMISARPAIASTFSGPVAFANDLDDW